MNPMKTKALAMSMTAILLLAAASAQAAEAKKLGFRHTASKELRLDCDKDADAQAAHTCYDRDGNETKITAGKEWELIEYKRVCFRHKERDSIRVCFELTVPGGGATSHVCFNDKGQYFQPRQDWELMSGSSAICTEKIKHHDVPKTMQFRIRTE